VRTPLIKAIAFLGMVSLLVWVVSDIYARLSEKTVIYRYISDALNQRETTLARVDWRPAGRLLDRPFTEADAAQVEKVLDQAWASLTFAQETGNVAILSDAFTGVALERAKQSAADAITHGGILAVLNSSARPVFFHRDASILQLEVETYAVRMLIEEGALSHHQVTFDDNIVTFLNGGYGWRISNLERLDVIAPEHGSVEVRLLGRAGLNYYPAATPWSQFWREYEVETVEDDLARIRALGADSIRVFLTYDAFTDPEATEPSISHLRHFLDAAHQNGLSVVPTLFDLKPDFSPVTWVEDARYLDTVVPILADAPSVAYIDLKNEADLDFEAHGQAKILGWLTTIRAYLRETAPELGATIGWSSAEWANQLEAELEVISYHDYAPLDDARKRLDAVRAGSGGKPVAVTEIGYTSFDALGGFPGSPETQAEQLAAHIEALAEADGIFIWTLFDFASIDTAAIGSSPWRRRIQSSFGLLDSLGNEKPAARAVREAFRKID
jgi:hypothetical protein